MEAGRRRLMAAGIVQGVVATSQPSGVARKLIVSDPLINMQTVYLYSRNFLLTEGHMVDKLTTTKIQVWTSWE